MSQSGGAIRRFNVCQHTKSCTIFVQIDGNILPSSFTIKCEWQEPQKGA